MQPIRLRSLHLLTTTSICAAVLLTAGCDDSLGDAPELAIDDAAELAIDEHALDLAPPVSEPTPYQMIEDQDGMLIVDGSDFRVRIHRSRRVAELNVSRDQLAKWYAVPFSRWSPQATRRLYEVFQDEFDFIVFVPASEGQHHAITELGTSVRVSNDVQGLGLPLFDDTAWYGSEGRLQSAVMLGGIKHVVSGPSLRELGKRWGNGFLPTASPNYFGFSDVGGQLGGCSPDQVDPLGHDWWYCDFNGTSNWSPDGATHNDRPYARLELYLMGLVDPGGIPKITWADDGEWVDPDLGIFKGTLRTASFDELREGHGKRFPSHLESPKKFRTLFVMVSGGDLTEPALFHSFDSRVAEFAAPKPVINEPGMYNFFEATGGLATLAAEDLDAFLR
jgi:hypothetical protein